MSVRPLRDGTSAVMRSACAWWWIIPCMKRTSAGGVSRRLDLRELLRRERPGRLAGRAGLDDVRRGLACRAPASSEPPAQPASASGEPRGERHRAVAS